MAGGASSAATPRSLGLSTHLSDPASSAAADAERSGEANSSRSALVYSGSARLQGQRSRSPRTEGEISLFISVLISLPLTFQTHMIHD